MKWYKTVEVHGPEELETLLHEMFDTEWRLHSWSAGTADRIVVVFERRRGES
jgi:hypothetical protein